MLKRRVPSLWLRFFKLLFLGTSMGDKGGMGTSMTAGSGAAMGAQLTGSTAGLGEGVLGGRGTACMGGGGEGEKIGLG